MNHRKLLILLLTLFVTLFSGCSKDLDELQKRKDGFYEMNSDKPFSGSVRRGISTVGRIKNGKKDGKWTDRGRGWKKELTGFYKEGIRDGKWTWWSGNRVKMLEGFYDEGKKDGNWTQWHMNGQKEFEIAYEDEEYFIINAWYHNGEKMVENGNGKYKKVYMDGSYMEGTIENGKFIGRQEGWQENGERIYEGAFKNGKKDGPWMIFYESGRKKLLRTYKDGIKVSELHYEDKPGNILNRMIDCRKGGCSDDGITKGYGPLEEFRDFY